MDAREFLIRLNMTAREYTTMQGIKIVDNDGRELDKIVFNIEDNNSIKLEFKERE